MCNTICGKFGSNLYRARVNSSLFKVRIYCYYHITGVLTLVILFLIVVLLIFIFCLPIRCPGFLKLKIQSTYGPPVAFVDFQVTCVCVCHILFSLLFKEKLSDGISSNWDQWRLRSWIQSFKCVEFAK